MKRADQRLPLASAADRLRRRPGRPRKMDLQEDSVGVRQAPALEIANEKSLTSEAPVPGLCPIQPRLLDPESAARYLSVSYWTIRALEAAGMLSRVRLPLPGGRELRKLLYDREDLDRLILRSKDRVVDVLPSAAK